MSQIDNAASPPATRTSKRATAACKACNLRKVRCTVTLSGPPCANCSVDGIACEIMSRKRRRRSNLDQLVPDTPTAIENRSSIASRRGQPRRRAHPSTSIDGSQPKDSTVTCNDQAAPPPQKDSGEHAGNSRGNTPQGPTTLADSRSEVRSQRPEARRSIGERDLPTNAAFGSRRPPNPSDAVEDSSAYADALEGGNGYGDGCVPFYTGDQRGPAFVMDICEPHRSSEKNHFLVPMPSIKSLLPEDINYLWTKGSFTLPPHHIREALIRCYFHHVHPFSPILDANDFLLNYEKGRMSLLLLWSMFLAAASFIDESMLTEDLFPSRKALKCAMYQRAKALYDADYEKDKITLIQSVFLMGHWYTTTDDRAGPWHWTGIAIGLSHTVGLHHLPITAHQVSHGPRPFWRRLWWSLYCREVWLSLGLGRPMRIALDDSDTAMPGTGDSDVISPELIGEVSRKYLPEELSYLFEIWLDFVKLTAALGNVLSKNYRAKGVKLSRADIERSESEIRASYPTFPGSNNQGRVVASHIYLFKLYFEAAIIVLYRPHILDSPREVSAADQGAWRTIACQKTRTAASNASGAVNSMMAEDLIGLCHTIAVIALIPPMQIHLFESTSSTPMAREMGKHNLALCMLAMDELRRSYVSADAAYKLFKAAINKVDNAPPHEEQGHPSSLIPSAATRPAEGAMDGNLADWPDGYDLSTAGIISDLWGPFSNTLFDDSSGTNNDAWLDIQSMDRLWTLDDLSCLDSSNA
ncbi:Uncharacterized protein BP5553_10090 [Venustampulla echinocandica]|uniref:Zn(2)-C6 fungal-type domain-containing protein n=1 Tax=Venustampulla echinocandica TaxID=2656787 RepID=A0A370TAB7_9HELO|nr:Uncharacterized protein BP5553_10090 [Venustampulla echinocandica]RDL30745.1 Uncharacterized protein BP5553_10090 [Venustampulla echinocandica]